MKNAVRHILTVDRRDGEVFPTEGSKFKLTQEFAGIGGDIGFFKNELEVQANVPLNTLGNLLVNGHFFPALPLVCNSGLHFAHFFKTLEKKSNLSIFFVKTKLTYYFQNSNFLQLLKFGP